MRLIASFGCFGFGCYKTSRWVITNRTAPATAGTPRTDKTRPVIGNPVRFSAASTNGIHDFSMLSHSRYLVFRHADARLYQFASIRSLISQALKGGPVLIVEQRASARCHNRARATLHHIAESISRFSRPQATVLSGGYGDPQGREQGESVFKEVNSLRLPGHRLRQYRMSVRRRFSQKSVSNAALIRAKTNRNTPSPMIA